MISVYVCCMNRIRLPNNSPRVNFSNKENRPIVVVHTSDSDSDSDSDSFMQWRDYYGDDERGENVKDHEKRSKYINTLLDLILTLNLKNR